MGQTFYLFKLGLNWDFMKNSQTLTDNGLDDAASYGATVPRPPVGFRFHERWDEPDPDEPMIDALSKPEVSDERGIPRLHLVRGAYFDGLGELDDFVKMYLSWANKPEYIKIATENEHGERVGDEKISECRKRGNGLYRWLLKKKISWLGSFETTQFFNPGDRKADKHTKMLFATLTFDTKLKTRDEAWKDIPGDYHRWICAIRRYYRDQGVKVSVFRTFEATKQGYPHIHALLLFTPIKKGWRGFRVVAAPIGGAFRIFRAEQDVFSRNWHSFVDIAALYEIGPRLHGYLTKYLIKNIGGDDPTDAVKRIAIKQARLTLTLLWIHRRQAYAISGDFRKAASEASDLIRCGGIETLDGILGLPDAQALKYVLLLSPGGFKTWTDEQLGKPPPDTLDVVPAPPDDVVEPPAYCDVAHAHCTDRVAGLCDVAGSVKCRRSSKFGIKGLMIKCSRRDALVPALECPACPQVAECTRDLMARPISEGMVEA